MISDPAVSSKPISSDWYLVCMRGMNEEVIVSRNLYSVLVSCNIEKQVKRAIICMLYVACVGVKYC